MRDEVYEAIELAQSEDDDISLREAVATVAAKEQHFVDFILSSEFEQEFGGSAAKLSAHWIDQAEEFEGDDALFARDLERYPSSSRRSLISG